MRAKADNHGPHLITAAHARRAFDVSRTTLRRWADAGRVRFTGATGNRRYNVADIERELGATASHADVAQKARVIYARVSSSHQRADLERQVADLRHAYPDHEVVTDVASGINWRRPGLRALLERVLAGTVAEIVVAHRDRLCRFAFDLVEFICRQAACHIVVHGSHDTEAGELADDLLAIVTVFVARNNGERSARNRRVRAAAQAAEAAAAAQEDQD